MWEEAVFVRATELYSLVKRILVNKFSNGVESSWE